MVFETLYLERILQGGEVGLQVFASMLGCVSCGRLAMRHNSFYRCPLISTPVYGAAGAQGLRQHQLSLQRTSLPLPMLPLLFILPSMPQVESFAQGLQQHQLATLPDGSTVLERSVTEHNLEAASKL